MNHSQINSIVRELSCAVQPAPTALQPVVVTHHIDDGDGFARQHNQTYSALTWSQRSVQSLLASITDRGGSRQLRAWQYNNELTSRVDYLHRCDVPVQALDVVRRLHADLHESRVDRFMNSYAAFTLGQRFNLAGYSGDATELGPDMLTKAHNPSGLFKSRKSRERLAELMRSQPMCDGNTSYVFKMPFVESRLDALVQEVYSLSPLMTKEAAVFELQKLALLIGGATPEFELRRNQGQVAVLLVDVLSTDFSRTPDSDFRALFAYKVRELMAVFDKLKPQVV